MRRSTYSIASTCLVALILVQIRPFWGAKSLRSDRVNVISYKYQATPESSQMKSQNIPAQFHISREQIFQLIAVASKRDAALVALMGLNGLRRNEAIELKTNQIDFELDRLNIIGKGKKHRVVPFDEVTKKILRDWLHNSRAHAQTSIDEEQFVFPSRFSAYHHMNQNHVNRALEKVGKDAGIKNPDPAKKYINPHLLRHSHAHYLKKKGVPLEAIRDILGHATILTTADQYGRFSLDDIQNFLKQS